MLTGLAIGFVGGIFFAAAQPGPSDVIRYAAKTAWTWVLTVVPGKK